MDYYVNEYSLREQFADINEFFDSLREYTLPMLKKIEQEHESVIWKKDDLWNAGICKGVTLSTIPVKRNERSPEKTILLNKLIKLRNEKPHWSETDSSEIKVKAYEFDYEYREYFSKINCFVKAIESEGRIISFVHEEYKCEKLKVILENENIPCLVDNIYDVSWWDKEPEIETWYIEGKYKVEVRAKEFEYHPPHFHVSFNEWAAVFELKNGKLYRLSGKKELLQKERDVIDNWYCQNQEKLREAWNRLHPTNVGNT